MSILKGFFEFALQNEWMTATRRGWYEILVAPPARTSGTSKSPFGDEELNRMLAACTSSYGKRPIKWDRKVHHREAVNAYANYTMSWTGEDLADFIMVSVQAGLRISDVCTFDIARLRENPGLCHVRTEKNNEHVYHKLPDWLIERSSGALEVMARTSSASIQPTTPMCGRMSGGAS